MELEKAKADFQKILSSFGSDVQKEQFFAWLEREHIGGRDSVCFLRLTAEEN